MPVSFGLMIWANPGAEAALAARFAFWSSLCLLGYTFAGYHLLSWVLGKCRARPLQKDPGEAAVPPGVSVVVVARNEAGRIVGRIENLLECACPGGGPEIVVVSDGSTDATGAKVRGINASRVNLIEVPERRGKSFCVNLGVEAAKGEFIVFADARQRFSPDALEHLVENFRDPMVGAVSGSLEVEPAADGTGKGVDLYWRLEKNLRLSESQSDSCIGCTGAIYAIRRELYGAIPENTLLDDVVIPMQIVAKGFHVVFDPRARAFDPQPLGGAKERRRKIRTLAGNYQMLFRHSGWLLPWNNRLWWRLISHKYLRLLAPFALMILFLSNAALVSQPFYAALFAGQIAFYAAAGCGIAFPRLKTGLLAAPAAFLFLNATALAALWRYLRQREASRW